MAGERERERFWNQLLGYVAKGDVVPVVGEDLLQVPGQHGRTTVYQALAERFAESNGLEMDAEEEKNLSLVVTRNAEFLRNPHDISNSVGEEYASWAPPIPEALRALARVTHLNLFVSTTFDDLLERALNEERFGGKRHTEVISYSPKSVPTKAAIEAQLQSGYPVVFQMFGNCRNALRYALTEGDKVEYIHALQTAEYRPDRIFSEFYDRPLLMLGNRFPDWLTRIFLRMIRNTPLNDPYVPKQYVSDIWGTSDEPIRFFLSTFATNTRLVEEPDPVALVLDLSRRWAERFGTQPQPSLPAASSLAKPMPKNAIFISYCATDSSGQASQDYPRALRLRDALQQMGIDVWFDKDQLLGGDEFERNIQRYIKTCSLFVPLISRTTEARDDGFFRKEWNWALHKLQEFTGSDRQFICPVVLDQLNPYKAKVPDEFKRFQFATMYTAEPEPALLDRIQFLYQQVRREA